MPEPDEPMFPLPEMQRSGEEDTGLHRRQNPVGRREADQERTWLYKLMLGCTAVSVICATVCLVVSGTVLKNRADIVHVQDVTKAIQDERATVTVENCVAQNKRNKEAKRKIRAFLEGAPADPQIDKRVVLALTDVLTDAQVPMNGDCKALADKNVRAGGS